VWPHENSLIALGMRRYGFAAEAAAVARDHKIRIRVKKIRYALDFFESVFPA
jgi:CHAD domain-containing protein